MITADLARELEAACLGMHVVDARLSLIREGIRPDVMPGGRELGCTRIERFGDHYQPMPGGEPAFIIPEWIRVNDDLADPAWKILDLTAVPLAEPTTVLIRLGLAWGLGTWAISRALAFDQPLDIYPTVFHWLQAGRNGLVIIDDSDVWCHLGWVREMRVHCPDLGRHLDHILTPPILPKPDILVPRGGALGVSHV